jgi:hypothetical protein
MTPDARDALAHKLCAVPIEHRGAVAVIEGRVMEVLL